MNASSTGFLLLCFCGRDRDALDLIICVLGFCVSCGNTDDGQTVVQICARVMAMFTENVFYHDTQRKKFHKVRQVDTVVHKYYFRK